MIIRKHIQHVHLRHNFKIFTKSFQRTIIIHVRKYCAPNRFMLLGYLSPFRRAENKNIRTKILSNNQKSIRPTITQYKTVSNSNPRHIKSHFSFARTHLESKDVHLLDTMWQIRRFRNTHTLYTFCAYYLNVCSYVTGYVFPFVSSPRVEQIWNHVRRVGSLYDNLKQ